jgi:hypothetical protein
VELHRLTLPELSSVDGGCADVYVNEDGQNGAYGEGVQVASGFCPAGTGSTTIQFDTPYTTTSDGVTVEFVSTIGGPVRAPLDETVADRDGYENSERGDAGDFVANLTVSTGLPANVSLRDSAGDVVSFGTFADNETVTETVDLQTGDSFKPSFAANGADLIATVRYQEISHSANPAVTVNGNRTEYAGTLAPGETVTHETDHDCVVCGGDIEACATTGGVEFTCDSGHGFREIGLPAAALKRGVDHAICEATRRMLSDLETTATGVCARCHQPVEWALRAVDEAAGAYHTTARCTACAMVYGSPLVAWAVADWDVRARLRLAGFDLLDLPPWELLDLPASPPTLIDGDPSAAPAEAVFRLVFDVGERPFTVEMDGTATVRSVEDK